MGGSRACNMDSLRKLLKIFNQKQKLQFIGVFFVIFLGSIFELLGVSILIPFMEALVSPVKLQKYKIVRDIMQLFHVTTQEQLVILMIIAMIVVFLVKNLYLVFAQYVQYQTMWHNRVKMETDIMAYYISQPYMFHVQKNSAEMQRIILQDMGNVFTVITDVFSLASEVITSTLLIVMLFLTSKTITISVMILLGGFMLLYFKIFKKRLYKYGKIAQKYGAEGLKCINQAFNGIKEIKVYECEPYFIKEFHDGRVIQASMMKRGAFFQQTPKYFLEMISTCGILAVMLIQLLRGVNMSNLMTQLAVFALAAYRILPSANRITAELATIFNNKASIDLIYQAMKKDKLDFEPMENNVEESETEKDEIVNGAGDILLTDVSFSYPGNDKVILDHVSLEVKKGKSVAFKGPSGAGKTTTADLILGILKPTSGVITYAGVDIEKLGKDWYKHLGYIPQTIYLSDDTIRKNVAFGEENPDEEKIWNALEGAQLKEFVKSRPEGLNLRLGEAGVLISGGQRQRIGIARALYNDPEILILDEATSALDNDTEAAVMESIEYLKGKKTLIIIAHRLSTIENCDEIFEINDGKLTKVK